MILSHPDRSISNFRPLKAFKHFRNLIADKEDTEQVFHITESLRTARAFRNAVGFLQSDAGKMLVKRNENLPDILDDHAALNKLPDGSLGRAYADFMKAEGLTANGLVEESKKFDSKMPEFDDQISWYANRMRDTHDMNHILTGYGRDPLGEQCVLAFTYSQNFSLGFYFIAYAGGWEVKKHAPSGTPVFKPLGKPRRTVQKRRSSAFKTSSRCCRNPWKTCADNWE